MKCERLIRCLMLLAAIAATARAQPSSDADPPKGKISGRIVAAGSHRPLRGVMVTLVQYAVREVDQRRPSGIRTDQSGTFEFERLAADTYDVYCSKPGYSPASGSCQTIILGRDEIASGIEIELAPPSVITGAVLDPDGNPMPGIDVAVERPSRWSRHVKIEVFGSVRTDEHGRYRIWNLTPGRYSVRAYQRSARTLDYAPTYYPSTTDMKEAARVRVEWDAVADGIDIHLQPAARTMVRGRIHGGDPSKVNRHSNLYAARLDGVTRTLDQFTVSNNEGNFRMTGLPPGLYRFSSDPYDRQYFASADVQVVEDQMTEVDLELLPGVKVSGIVRPAIQPDKTAPQPIRSFVSFNSGDHVVGQVMIDSSGGSFVLDSLVAGKYQIVSNCGGGRGYVVSAAVEGRELPARVLTVEQGVPIEGLEVRCGVAEARIEGVIKPSADEAPFKRLPPVNLWFRRLDDPSLFTNRYLPFGSGRFGQLPLLPGRYTFYAISELLQIEWDDPEVQRALAPYSQTVEIKAGQSASLDLIFVPSSFRLP